MAAATIIPIDQDIPLPDDGAAADEARTLLAEGGLLLKLSPRLHAAFHAERQRGLDRYIRIGSLPLVVLVIGLVIINTRRLDGLVDGHDRATWFLGSSVVTLVVALGVILVQVPWVRRRYTFFVSLFAGLMLAKLALWPQLLVHPVAAVAESQFCMLALIIVTLALRIGLRASATICTLTGVISTLVLALLLNEARWWDFANYYGTTTGVCLFVAWLQEQQEQRNFLQAVVIAHDRREREALNRQLDDMAHQDALSGLANRRRFDAMLGSEWDRAMRDGKPLALLFIDIDHFKLYNDTFGHSAGDECLAAIGGAISMSLLRPADLAARYGGEEFVVLLPDTDLDGALDVARRVLASIDALAIDHPQSAHRHVTASIGVADAMPAPMRTAQEMLVRADRALYVAKQSGRHRVQAAS